ncbi:MAG: nuclear transport factor 2 family protein [Labilithrix sp.]
MTRAAIKHAEDALRSAILAADVEALDRLIDDELVFLGPTGTLATKAEDLESYRSAAQRVTAHHPRDLEITLFGEDTAVATLVVALEGEFRGRRIAGDYRYLRTWRRGHDGRWRIIAGAVVGEPDA